MKYIREYKDIDWVEWDEEEIDPNIPDDFKDNKDFYYFLVENDILDKFLYNFKTISQIKPLSKLLSSSNYNYLNSFRWSSTKEGANIWFIYHNKWNNYLIDKESKENI